MTPCAVVKKGTGVLTLDGGDGVGGKAEVRYDGALSVEVEEIKVEDARLAPVWGSTMRRIRLIGSAVGEAGKWVVEITES